VGAAGNFLIPRIPSLRSWIAPPEIDTARHLIENRTRFLELLDESRALVGHWFHLPALREALRSFPVSRRITSFQAMRLANLLLVLQAGRSRVSGPPAAAECR
jgi:hypothetical protein